MANVWNRYDATAARNHGRPGREARPKSLTFDIHSHVGVPRAAQLVAPHLDLSTVPLVHFQAPETRAVNAKQEEDLKTRITPAGFDQRLKDLDAMGLDQQLILPPPPQCKSFCRPPELIPAVAFPSRLRSRASRCRRVFGRGGRPALDLRDEPVAGTACQPPSTYAGPSGTSHRAG